MDSTDLLVGAIYSMESARSFLKDAILLYREGRCSTSCVLGTIAAEHLGQCHWLLPKWTKTNREAGRLDCKTLKNELERGHERMLRDGFVALQYGVPKPLSFEILTTLPAGTPEYAKAAERLEKAHKKVRARFPKKFLDLRIRAQYVKPSINCHQWGRPGQVGSTEVHDLLPNVGISYRVTLYFRFLNSAEVVSKLSEVGLKAAFQDVTSTWAPPEGDLTEKGPG